MDDYMSVLEVENLRFTYGEKELFNNTSFKIEPFEHIGFVGNNGVGKSTLLKLISHKLAPDKGEIKWLDHIEYSYLDQYLEVKSNISIKAYLYNVYEYLFDLEDELNKLYSSLEFESENRYDKILSKADKIQEELNHKGFYMIKAKIDNVLSGLGIKVSLNKPLRKLSGGERAKIFLAKILLEEKDVLLLDEPTNFLDAVHVEWLSKYLQSYKNAFLVISHNFEFLNDVSNYIIELSNKVIVKYKGNFKDYLQLKQLRDKQYDEKYISQQKYIKKTKEFIDKNIVRASTTNRAKSRRKILEKLEVLDKPITERVVNFSFPFTSSFDMEAIKVKNLEIGYTKPILSNINISIRFGEKVAIIGKNGIGKTTFLKTVLGLIPKLGGTSYFNPLNKITYYSQDLKVLKGKSSLDYIRDDYPLMDDIEIRSLLGKVGLSGELAIKDMDKLSGGEVTKARLAKLMLEKSNMLIFDEPTNHLDKIAKAALFKAIQEYPGTVIIVSHEREFYKNLQLKEIIFS